MIGTTAKSQSRTDTKILAQNGHINFLYALGQTI